ncbi:hypothetical protein MML48_2g00021596 [Holotrichia oblita]|uniref:Uncharacterized protein n=1 Tax=Holotrichia oblita TaxID=644536 RepID=A0ACB9TKP5_HOLOL|nr:hypothetical protein MML48_2g00021596 [Holotrichia oblita]
MNSQDITISDPCTGEPKISWKWYQFHQFHLQAPCHPEDEKTICVMHTSAEFIAGPGQVYIYCKQSPKLLDYLLNRGKYPKSSPGLISSRRLSRSEEIFVILSAKMFRIVRCVLEMGSSLTTLGMALLTKTPGGSETNGESLQDLSIISETHNILSRRESGISLASGIYEEILDVPQTNNEKGNNSEYAHHVYENPEDVIQKLAKNGKHIPPPPLPPRIYECNTIERDKISRDTSCTPMSTPYKHRCNTLPAKDLARISQIFTSESEYMIMTPTKQHILTEKIENHYMPMSPITNFKNKIENCYMAMSGKK